MTAAWDPDDDWDAWPATTHDLDTTEAFWAGLNAPPQPEPEPPPEDDEPSCRSRP